MFEPIQHIIGNYRLLKRLRQDGSIGVYLSEDQQNQRQVVLKTLDKRMDIVVPQASRAFVHAAHIMARLDHPNIIPLYDLGEQDTLLYLATAYGNPIRQRYPKGTRIPLETVVTYIKQGADALRYAHDQDIIHAHLKPENILLGDRNNVLMSDFGFAEPLYPPAHLSLPQLSIQHQNKYREIPSKPVINMLLRSWCTNGSQEYHPSLVQQKRFLLSILKHLRHP